MRHVREIVIFIFLFFVFIGVPPALAKKVTFEASVDRTTVELGSYIQLTLTVEGTQSVEPVALPDIDGMQSRYIGPSTHVSSINGKYTVSVAYIYHLYPEKMGQFKIPSIQIKIEGQQYTSREIAVRVVSSGSRNISQGSSGAYAERLQDKVFVIMGIPKNEYYLHERIPLIIRLFVNNLTVKNVQYPELEYLGFVVDEFQKPVRYQQAINDIRYEVLEFKRFIYPTRTGDLSLGPVRQVCTILFKSQSRRRRSFSIFDDDFFNGFFSNYDARSITLEAEPLAIRVLELPTKDRPQGFSGAVGRFDFDMSLSPLELKAGDPITLRMKIEGEGDLKTVVFPEIRNKEDFKLYDPQITQEENAVVLEQVVIPRTEQVKEMTTVSFSYFDTVNQKYQTITRGPFALKVTPLEADEELKIVGLSLHDVSLGVLPEKIGRDIVFIKNFPGSFKPIGFYRKVSLTFYIAVILTIFLWAGLFVANRITHRMKTDERFARRLKAPRHARKGLLQARKYLEKGDQKQFYDSLFKTLQNYFVNKWHLQPGVINLDTIFDAIKDKGVKDSVQEYIKTVFEECEMVQYASVVLDDARMKDIYRQTEKIIDFFERRWK